MLVGQTATSPKLTRTHTNTQQCMHLVYLSVLCFIDNILWTRVLSATPTNLTLNSLFCNCQVLNTVEKLILVLVVDNNRLV